MNSPKIQSELDRAESLKLSGEHEQAIAICENILSEFPQCVEAMEEIGDNLISLHKFAAAKKALSSALKLNPESANSYYLMGFSLSCQKEWSESVKNLEQADRLKPNHPEILRCLGWSFFMFGEETRGIVLLERARALAPRDVFILTDLGVCYLNQRKIEKAVEIFQSVLEIDPHNEKARECLLVVAEFTKHQNK